MLRCEIKLQVLFRVIWDILQLSIWKSCHSGQGSVAMGKQKLHHLTSWQLLQLVEEEKLRDRYWKRTVRWGLLNWLGNKLIIFLFLSLFLFLFLFHKSGTLVFA